MRFFDWFKNQRELSRMRRRCEYLHRLLDKDGWYLGAEPTDPNIEAEYWQLSIALAYRVPISALGLPPLN